jgi:hypothetical protein
MAADTNTNELNETDDVASELDALTETQKRLDDLCVMFYTYIGIIQRDAPPSSRAPDETDEIPGDEASREELRQKIPEFAADILRTSGDIDAAAKRIADEYEADAGDERRILAAADEDSASAGVELSTAGKNLTQLLFRVRDAIYETEQDC